jgi:hypothetical protein
MALVYALLVVKEITVDLQHAASAESEQETIQESGSNDAASHGDCDGDGAAGDESGHHSCFAGCVAGDGGGEEEEEEVVVVVVVGGGEEGGVMQHAPPAGILVQLPSGAVDARDRASHVVQVISESNGLTP